METWVWVVAVGVVAVVVALVVMWMVTRSGEPTVRHRASEERTHPPVMMSPADSQAESARARTLLASVLDADLAAAARRIGTARITVGTAGAAEIDQASDRHRDAASEAHLWRTHQPGWEHLDACTRALAAAGRHLARAGAIADGRPAPENWPPCLLDPTHGPATTEIDWTPDGAASRRVPVCAADAARFRMGQPALVRVVPTTDGDRPYVETSWGYGEWLLGYFGGFDPYRTAGLLAGTPLGDYLPERIRRADPHGDPVGR